MTSRRDTTAKVVLSSSPLSLLPGRSGCLYSVRAIPAVDGGRVGHCRRGNRTLAHGSSLGGVVDIVGSTDRQIRVEWLGRDLIEEELRWVRVTVRSAQADGSIAGKAVVQWDDRHPAAPQLVNVPAGHRIQFRVERRGPTGVQADAWQTVRGDVIPVVP